MSMELEGKRNDCDAFIDMNVNTNSFSTPADPSTTPVDFPTWKVIIKVLGLIIWAIFFYCLLTLGTVMVVSILLLVNTVIHLIDSMKGDAGYRTVVLSPISRVVSVLILLLAIIILSVSLGIIEAVDPSEQPILLGLDISQWIKIHIIVLGYYCVGIISPDAICKPDAISKPWRQGLWEEVKCLLFLPAMFLVMNVVPEWKHHSFVGLPTWKWIRDVIIISVVGNNVIGTTIRIILRFTGLWCGKPEECKGTKCTFYYVQGLRRSITLIAIALMHLLTWNTYFRPRLGKSAVADKVLHFGASTFVSGLICGVLLLIKSFILLSWKAHTIYERSNEELIRKLTQWYCLYSLGLVRCRMAQDLDQLRTATADDDHQRGNFTFGLLRRRFLVDNQQKYKEIKLVRQITKWKEAKEAIIEVVSRKEHAVERASSIHSELQGEVARDVIISMHEKEILARTFVYGERSLPNDQDILSFCQRWREKYNVDNDPDFGQREISQEDVKKFIEDAGQVSEIGDDNLKDAEQILYKQLQETNKTTQTTVCAQDFETWMERAQQNCLQLRYFLASAEEVVKFLNRIMVGFIVVFVIIAWLLLTKVLPTKVIVVVTSPILAAAFIFGDTLKTMFQGIVFAYFMHPFTVGDLCIIDHIQMEVKQIGIWRTTFSKVGTEEEVLYPNSVLASQAIVNLDGNLLLRDFVEFSLHYDTKGIAIKSLEDSIKRCINPERSGSEPDAQAEIQESDTSDRYEPSSDDENVLVTKQVQDNIKITVHFVHHKNILDMTHAEAFNEKLRRKSEILREVANCVSEYRRSLVKDQGD